MQIRTETRVGFFVLAAIAIFLYMSFHIGVFRFGTYRYAPYIIYFDDVSGLKNKADVKISGVKVGWVDKIDLLSHNSYSAKVKVMIHRSYALHENAYAIIRQDGLLGSKFLEIEPGDRMFVRLPAGSTLDRPGKPPVEIDELIQQTKRVTQNLEEITDSLKNVFGGTQRQEQLAGMLDDMGSTIRSLKEAVPAVKEGIIKISDVFDRDFTTIASKLGHTADAVEDAAGNVSEGFKNISSVAEKIDKGKGLLGKLVTEDETYYDLKETVAGVKNYFAKVERTGVVFDSHFESMYRLAESYEFEDSKGYVDVRIHPCEDRFYLIQFMSTQKGAIERRVFNNQWFSADYDPLDRSVLSDRDQFRFPAHKDELLQRRDTFKFGLQFGKIFDNIAFRFGIFENSAGVGIDYDIPFESEKFRWVTTVELFDFRGRDRVNDSRPHLKWLNRMFVFNNIFLVFGADDFVSERNANGFFGLGLRFGDDDIKYLASSFSSFGGTSGAFANTSLRQ